MLNGRTGQWQMFDVPSLNLTFFNSLEGDPVQPEDIFAQYVLGETVLAETDSGWVMANDLHECGDPTFRYVMTHIEFKQGNEWITLNYPSFESDIVVYFDGMYKRRQVVGVHHDRRVVDLGDFEDYRGVINPNSWLLIFTINCDTGVVLSDDTGLITRLKSRSDIAPSFTVGIVPQCDTQDLWGVYNCRSILPAGNDTPK
jgi:hypothetical protein